MNTFISQCIIHLKLVILNNDSIRISEQKPDLATFKTLLHQQLQSLFGIIYSNLSIDIIRYAMIDEGGENVTKIILRIISCDRDMILQTLPFITAYQGHRCTIITHTCTPHLFLITNKT